MSNTKTSIAHWRCFMVKCATVLLNYEEVDVLFNKTDIISIMNNTTGEYYNIENIDVKRLFSELEKSQINNVV